MTTALGRPAPDSLDPLDETPDDLDAPLIFNEAQLILAEKRTYLAMLRTGIAIIALPLTVVSFLIAASKAYEIPQVAGLLIPLLAVCLGLAILGIYLVVKSILKLRQSQRLLDRLKAAHPRLSKLVD